MARFYGVIGYAITKETNPGNWEEIIEERSYYGELNRVTRRLEGNDKVNNDINISHDISVIADPFAYQNFHSIRYVEYMGAKWKVSSIEVKYPRLILSVGGIYNA